MSSPRSEISPGYSIRKVQDRDLDRIAAIARQAWVPIHKSFAKIMGESLHQVLYPDWEATKADQVRRHAINYPDWVYVVESDESSEVVAFVTFRIDTNTSVGTIGNNAVSKEVQGKGFGTAMYKYVLDRFREMGMKFAEVTTGLDEGHAPARRAYEKAGFDRTRETVTFYKYL